MKKIIIILIPIILIIVLTITYDQKDEIIIKDQFYVKKIENDSYELRLKFDNGSSAQLVPMDVVTIFFNQKYILAVRQIISSRRKSNSYYIIPTTLPIPNVQGPYSMIEFESTIQELNLELSQMKNLHM